MLREELTHLDQKSSMKNKVEIQSLKETIHNDKFESIRNLDNQIDSVRTELTEET